jgi:hypothetical protein
MKGFRAVFGRFGLVALLAVAHASTALASPLQPGAREAAGQMSEQQMMERCKQAMAQHEQMMSRMKAADAALDELVSRMNAASGDEKVEAMAAVVNEIVTQRRAMHSHMMQMHEHMMSHMTEHMHMGDMQAMRRSMQACPMMRGMPPPGQNR